MAINLEQITVYTAERQPILHNISCHIHDRHITLLIGRTGAGKSTLLDSLSGLIAIDEGSIFYDQTPLWVGKRLNPSVQLAIGNVFQYPEQQLFARTVQGEFDYSLRPFKLSSPEIRARTLTALSDIGLPAHLTTESPLLLSGGQKRRVALASTFATKPTWLFLDEPTAGLDPEAVKLFLGYLTQWRQNRQGGIVIATHDIDVLLPVADAVVIMHRGNVISVCTPQALCDNPQILIEAEIGIPSTIELFTLLKEQRIDMLPGPISPEQYAQSILKGYHHKTGEERTYNNPPTNSRSGEDRAEVLHTEEAGDQDQELVATNHATPAQQHDLLHRLDPRSKWICYVLISFGIFIQSQWLGLLFGTIVTLAIVLVARLSWRDIALIVKPFMVLIAISVLLAGTRWGQGDTQWHIGPVYFVLQSAFLTFTQLYKLLLITILGVLFSMTTSQMKIKQGLEQSLSFLRRFKFPVEAFSLATSLMLRFIPVIMKEARRFSRITRARGKQPTKIGAVRFRDMQVLIIPLVLSVLQLGSDLSLAMEARGYTHIGLWRTTSYELKIRRADRWAIGIGIGIAAMFLFLQYGTR